MRRVTAGSWLSRAASFEAALALTGFLLPTQLGKHFWPDWSYLQGLRSDYLAPTFYLTDILIFWILSYLAIRIVLNRLLNNQPLTLTLAQKTYLILSGGLILTALFSIYAAENRPVARWDAAKLFEFVLWGGVVTWALDRRYRPLLIGAFLAGAAFQAGLGLAQFILGHSVGLWLLGERTFDSATPGIAQAVISGKLVLRAYGTLPHPNLLGIYLTVAATVGLWLGLKEGDRPRRLALFVLTTTLTLGLLASLSRLAIILYLAAAGFIFIKNLNRSLLSKRAVASWLVWSAATVLLFSSPLLSRYNSLAESDALSVTRRIEQTGLAVTFWQQSPWSGIGLGNFVVRAAGLPSSELIRTNQPAHNLYLLVLAEVGIIGLGFLVSLLFLAARSLVAAHNWLALLILGEVVLAGLFDHYFWTLQAGGLLFWSIVGGLYSQMAEPEVTPDRPPARLSS